MTQKDPRSRFIWDDDDIEIVYSPDKVEENLLPRDKAPLPGKDD